MRKLIGLTAGMLFIASAGFAFDALNCSDASGILRMSKIKTEDGKTTQWFYEGSQYNSDDVKAEINDGSKRQVVGDEYNGVYFALAKFKAYELKIKNRPVICQKVNDEKSKVLPDETPTEFTPWQFPPQMHCSNPTGTIRKVGDFSHSTWFVKNEPVPPSAIIMANLKRTFDMGFNSWIYEIVIRYEDSEEVPTFVLCQ